MSKLKPGWKRVKFGDVVRLGKESCKNPEAEGLERYIALEHMTPNDLKIRSWGNIAEGTTFTRRCRPGQVLFGKRRAYQRKVAICEFDAVCSGDIYVFESLEPARLLPELLPFICQTESFFEFAVGTSAGSLSPRTNWKSLQNYELALPPLEEQRRIARALGKSNLAVECSTKVLTSITTIERSYIKDTFSHLFSSAVHLFRVDEVGEVKVGRQRSPKHRTGPHLHPYLRVANVFDGYINTSDVLMMSFNPTEFEKYLLRDGDVLLNEGQSRELVGRSSIFRNEVDGCCFQNTLIRFRPHLTSPEYAHAVFRYWLYTGGFVRVAKQTTSIAHLGSTRFSAMRMPVVSKSIQKEIVTNLSEISDAKNSALRQLQKAKYLKQSLLTNLLMGRATQ